KLRTRYSLSSIRPPLYIYKRYFNAASALRSGSKLRYIYIIRCSQQEFSKFYTYIGKHCIAQPVPSAQVNVGRYFLVLVHHHSHIPSHYCVNSACLAAVQTAQLQAGILCNGKGPASMQSKTRVQRIKCSSAKAFFRPVNMINRGA